MNRIIKNYDELAISKLRHDALTIAESGLQAIDTALVLKNSIKIVGNCLQVKGQVFDLTKYKHIYIIGFGKVACTAAYTLEKLLENRVKEGAVIGMSQKTCQIVDTYTGTHPLPSAQNHTATKHIEEVARQAREDDLVLVIVSGGGSALLCSSMGECDQGIKLFESFLKSGGTIEELNTVRKHISHLKGGGLAKALYPATVIGLVFSDVPGGDLAAVASGPTYLDNSTVADAQNIIDKYNLGSFHLIETPKDKKYFAKVHNIEIVSNVIALEAMQQTAEKLSYRADIISTSQYNTAEETKSLLLEETKDGKICFMGGETKVTIPEQINGKGGRNGHLTLTMLESIAHNQVFISFASDGHDNTEAAGAIADLAVLQQANKARLPIREYLSNFDSFSFFDQLKAHIKTGILESNVSDLILLLTATDNVPEATITDIKARIINDSRAKPTIEVTVETENAKGTFSVPSGASTGKTEVSTLPAKQAVQIIKKLIKPLLLGNSVIDQAYIDTKLHDIDGTDNFKNIGGNVALGVSVAASKAAAATLGIPTWQHIAQLFKYQAQAKAPRLFVNLINGGKHAKVGSPIQEHQIIPDTDNVKEALQAVRKIQQELKALLYEQYNPKEISYGDEGGFVIPSKDIFEPFRLIEAAISAAGCDIKVAMSTDIAASSFYQNNQYHLDKKDYSAKELLELYQVLHNQFPNLIAVEDPFAEADFESFASYHKNHPDILTVGDDLTTTNIERLKEAIAKRAINAIIIKPNQIGTLSDTLATMELAYQNDIRCIVSHRSGETEDDFIADLAYGTKCYGFKAGAPTQPERAVKYGRLLKITN